MSEYVVQYAVLLRLKIIWKFHRGYCGFKPRFGKKKKKRGPFVSKPLEIQFPRSRWPQSDVIAMIVVGFVLLIIFPFYEKFWAPKSFIPWTLLRDRTIFGCCLTIRSLFFGFYCWDLYFNSFLQVVFDLDVTQVGYVGNIYSIRSTFWAIVVG